jgi:hypothetical protein
MINNRDRPAGEIQNEHKKLGWAQRGAYGLHTGFQNRLQAHGCAAGNLTKIIQNQKSLPHHSQRISQQVQESPPLNSITPCLCDLPTSYGRK